MANDICDSCGKVTTTEKYTTIDGQVLDLCDICYMLYNLNDKVDHLTGMVTEIVKDKV